MAKVKAKQIEGVSAVSSGDAILYETYKSFPVPKESGTVTVASTTSGTYVVKDRLLLRRGKFTRDGTTFAGTLFARGQVSLGAGKNGDVRLFNETDGVELAVINFDQSNTSFTLKSIAMSSLPASGDKVISIEMRALTAATTFEIDLLVAEFRADVT